jgi:hypothetical protein
MNHQEAYSEDIASIKINKKIYGARIYQEGNVPEGFRICHAGEAINLIHNLLARRRNNLKASLLEEMNRKEILTNTFLAYFPDRIGVIDADSEEEAIEALSKNYPIKDCDKEQDLIFSEDGGVRLVKYDSPITRRGYNPVRGSRPFNHALTGDQSEAKKIRDLETNGIEVHIEREDHIESYKDQLRLARQRLVVRDTSLTIKCDFDDIHKYLSEEQKGVLAIANN